MTCMTCKQYFWLWCIKNYWFKILLYLHYFRFSASKTGQTFSAFCPLDCKYTSNMLCSHILERFANGADSIFGCVGVPGCEWTMIGERKQHKSQLAHPLVNQTHFDPVATFRHTSLKLLPNRTNWHYGIFIYFFVLRAFCLHFWRILLAKRQSARFWHFRVGLHWTPEASSVFHLLVYLFNGILFSDFFSKVHFCL